jgi:hypothetical protein
MSKSKNKAVYRRYHCATKIDSILNQDKVIFGAKAMTDFFKDSSISFERVDLTNSMISEVIRSYSFSERDKERKGFLGFSEIMGCTASSPNTATLRRLLVFLA